MLPLELKVICYSGSKVLSCPYYLEKGCDEVCNYSQEMNNLFSYGYFYIKKRWRDRRNGKDREER